MGEKYIIQAPKKKKLKIKLSMWRIASGTRNFREELRSRIVFTRNNVQGQIAHKSLIDKS